MKAIYVLGFLFSDSREAVVLIEKKKPVWQVGKLNGLGGKVLPGETSQVAMAREFLEESGVNIDPLNWVEFCTMAGSDFVVHCFAFAHTHALCHVHSTTPEQVQIVNVRDLAKKPVIANLHWLIPMAIESMDCELQASIHYA